jgi:hypothetical protein
MKHRVSSFLAVSFCTALLPSAVFAQSQQDRPSSGAAVPANAPVVRRGQCGPHPLHRGNQLERYDRDNPCGFVHQPRNYL